MYETKALVERLLGSQNPDGGWSYTRGVSWTEPTALSVLALGGIGDSSASYSLNRGMNWLKSHQDQSGGWYPTPSVPQCTSVTSLATLALMAASQDLATQIKRGLDWVSGQIYSNDLSVGLMISRFFNLPPPHAPGSVPWYPGTAGWVSPTAYSVLVLTRAGKHFEQSSLTNLALKSCNYLLSRRCSDGGWNHGGSSLRSENSISYPETTGLALLALAASGLKPQQQTLSLAERLLANPESIEGMVWLQMALRAFGRSSNISFSISPRTNRDLALAILGVSAQHGFNPLLS